MYDPLEHSDEKTMHKLVLENQRLLTENNQLLKKLYRHSIWSFWVRIVSFLIIVGVPFILYYYVIEPYFTSVQSSLESFQGGLQQVPGWSQFYDTVFNK